MISTAAAEKLRLGRAVAPVGKPAAVAPLGGMSWVNRDYLATTSFGLVLQEALELGEAPRVKSPLSFTARGLGPSPDVNQVLHHNGSARLNAFEDRGRQNVIAVPSEALFASSEASKVPLGTLRTVGLQCASEAKGAFDYFFHVPIAVETVVGGDGGVGDAEVHPDSLPIRDKGDFRQADHQVKVEPTLPGNKVGCGHRTAFCISGIFGQPERNLDPASGSRETHIAPLPVDLEGMKVVSRGAQPRLGTLGTQPLLLSGYCRPYGFGSLANALYVQVRDQTRERLLVAAINQFVKGIGVAIALFPTHAANGIERLSELRHRLGQSPCLLCRRLKQYTDRSIHIWIIPHISHYLQDERKEVCADSSAT